MADEINAAARNSAAVAGDEVKPYKIHVSTKYLELTRQKLELTRLPHEASEPKSEDWWEPKPQVEPLIDFWLEKYSWREQEEVLNRIPQFRTAISIPGSETPLRIHFVHFRSPHKTAVPLLLIPSFPLTNLSFGHLVKPFTDPEDVATTQPFHLVIPSLPGLGFSDAFPNNVPVISATAEMLNTVMTRLSYPHYLATNASAASASPAEIDWRLINYLATRYSSSCVGAHFVSPPLASPRMQEDPWEWTKWSLASLLHTGILGYSDDDFTALDRLASTPGASPSGSMRRSKATSPAAFGLNQFGLREPNTLAYALCDSPTGLLLYVMKGLRLLSLEAQFTPEQIINTTQLAWLPGPEYAMRFWASCAEHRWDDEQGAKSRKMGRPKVAITVFLGESASAASPDAGAEDAPSTVASHVPIPGVAKEHYVCPAWANARYNVAFTQRVPGRAGLLAWERPEVLTAGVRGLARQVLKLDSRLRAVPEPATAPLEQVVVSDPQGREVEPVAADVSGEATEGNRNGEPAAATAPPAEAEPAPQSNNQHLEEPQIGERAISDETIAVRVGEEQAGKDKDLLKPEAAALGAEGSSSSLLAERKAKTGQGPSDETIVAETPSPPASK
ncbi:uncharacterized protein E0L32_001878 [Thyridium curvatum]|uniref:Epoxide hydrolase N-terminal domain-containing protein n=1 Tax=Thyridium curvatum TaxID=1093900 RepID=A0A507AL86_9PEZI|nr:uncharacterized protein E0L32_001801 [Thyridium curvatum]XP_030990014.1 uncharacterized protein E0L32_001878 [Thyridium curvatum]TPX08226.1 hypothetical protein E0L32_001801 [Thyridium curvatum]TPX08303.1 hypothetical protein E0L32_001878 [Thyridium curvatum]